MVHICKATFLIWIFYKMVILIYKTKKDKFRKYICTFYIKKHFSNKFKSKINLSKV